MGDLPFAEDVGSYWKTSSVNHDTWIDRAEELIRKYGGEVVARVVGRQGSSEAIMLEFVFSDERFKVIWPVLESKYDYTSQVDIRRAAANARRQAATMLFHDVKSRGIRHAIAGPRVAFFEFLMLPNGQVVGELASPDLLKMAPKMLTGGS